MRVYIHIKYPSTCHYKLTEKKNNFIIRIILMLQNPMKNQRKMRKPMEHKT